MVKDHLTKDHSRSSSTLKLRESISQFPQHRTSRSISGQLQPQPKVNQLPSQPSQSTLSSPKKAHHTALPATVLICLAQDRLNKISPNKSTSEKTRKIARDNSTALLLSVMVLEQHQDQQEDQQSTRQIRPCCFDLTFARDHGP